MYLLHRRTAVTSIICKVISMYYKVQENPDRRFMKIHTARKAAIDDFAYWRDMGVHDPIIRIYLCNNAGKVEIGRVMKGPGYPIYVTKEGDIYRLSPKTGKTVGRVSK